MMSDTAMRSMLRNSDYGDELGRELGALHREEELNIYRSGSAPPTVEGSLSAVGGLFGKESPAFGFYEGGDCGGKGFMRDEELRSDPAYVSYYYSNVNLNPRLPPPLISREEVRFAQRFQGVGTGSALGGIGDRGKVSNGGITNSSSLFSMHKEQNGVESRNAAEWGGNGLIGLPGLGLGSRQKSIPEIIQDDVSRVKSISRHPSRPASRNAYDDEVETSKSLFSELHYESSSIDALRSGANTPGISPAQNIGSLAAQTYASALGASLSRSTTPDPKSLPRAPSPRIPPVGGGRSSSTNTRNINVPNSFSGVAAGMSESADLVAALSGMNLSTDGQIHEENHSRSKVNDVDDHQNLFNLQNDQNQLKQDSYFNKAGSGSSDNLFLKGISVPALHTSSGMNLSTDGQIHKENHSRSKVDDVDDHQNLFNLQNDQNQLQQDSYFNKAGSGLSDNLFLKRISVPALSNGRTSPSHYQNTDFTYSSVPNYGLNGYAINPASPSMMGNQLGNGNLPLLFENAAAASAMGVPAMDSRALGGDLASGPNFVSAAVELQNLSGVGNHPMDPLYLQYLRSTEYAAPRVGALNEPTVDREYMSSLYTDLLQKAYLGTLLSPQKSQYGAPYFGKSASLNHNYYGDPALGLGMSYQGSPLGGPLLPSSPIGYGSPVRRGERNLRFPSGIRNLAGGVMGAWDPEAGANFHENFASSLLDEFKSNKTRCFELSEIAGHVVEFSADQYGSRFIQQKLENATAEERDMVFHEIMPHTLSLMTDVFGNYVIQKFFEHGTAFQIRELADQLNGHVLTLSLQMYGCRVIQKAIEVAELDQQTKLVAELDGHVMRCVRDQNGNHVIQKCIECIPEDAIQFIISTFYNQVVTLSTHPYGCRVIQRVLEHCSDLKTQGLMMDEILDNACMLAQDQYGNYVVQHVLEHGKPHERSVIIKKLSGQIVQMSQQKFASNVVEKCLAFGDPVERQTLVNEMLGCTDENEPLQAMMKDQFANYVVQKVLETCDDQHLELILNRIKVHLNALKKYTYGKHIVARVEKLVTAAERRISVLCPNPAA